MQMILIGLVLGVSAGILSGMFGIGGGVIIVPVLVLIGLTQRQATATSLAGLLLPVGIFAVLEYAKRNEVRYPYAIGIAIGLTIGAFFGAKIAGRITNITLQRMFGGFLALVSLRLLIFAK